MIEIIKHGNPKLKPDPMKTFDCPTCHCTFKADKTDYHGINQYNCIAYFAKCPECGERAKERIMRGEPRD